MPPEDLLQFLIGSKTGSHTELETDEGPVGLAKVSTADHRLTCETSLVGHSLSLYRVGEWNPDCMIIYCKTSQWMPGRGKKWMLY